MDMFSGELEVEVRTNTATSSDGRIVVGLVNYLQ